jgi:hypothetical protein
VDTTKNSLAVNVNCHQTSIALKTKKRKKGVFSYGPSSSPFTVLHPGPTTPRGCPGVGEFVGHEGTLAAASACCVATVTATAPIKKVANAMKSAIFIVSLLLDILIEVVSYRSI